MTTLIRRLQNPTPTGEYEHKQRMLAHVAAHGSITTAEAAVVIGHTTIKNAARFLDELVDEGLLARHPAARTLFVLDGPQ